MKLNSILLLIGLIIIVISKEPERIKTEIEIVTTKHSKEEAYTLPLNSTEEEEQKVPSIKDQYAQIKNGSEEDNKRMKEEQEKKKELERKQKELEEKKQNSTGESESEKAIREARSNVKKKSSSKHLVLTAPYQDNEDYIIAPFGLGTPVNFAPLQIDTTTYKTWVSSVKNKQNPTVFNYNIKDSETGEESGEWDTVIDEEGTISGNVLYDKAYLGNFEIDHFKFIEAVEFEDDFHDFKNGKLGLGNCHYAEKGDLEFCLLQRLKDSGSIDRRIFSIREYSDTHGELVIGDVTSVSKEKDYPLLSLIDKDGYADIEDDEFKMGWLTKISHVIFSNSSSKDNLKKIFKNNIHIEEGLASFDSSCHYIEAPYSYINEFEDKMFKEYYPNACRKVNNDGVYMFLCDKKRFEEVRNSNKDLSFIIIMDGNGFEIPMDFLFEQTRENDYEFFVHFKDYEQNVWNLGHPFFHHYTVIFDQDNQEIGVDGEKIYSLKDETEAELKSHKLGGRWWKILLLVLLGLLILAAIFWIMRKRGINIRLDNGVSPSLVDNESVDDLSLYPSHNVN